MLLSSGNAWIFWQVVVTKAGAVCLIPFYDMFPTNIYADVSNHIRAIAAGASRDKSYLNTIKIWATVLLAREDEETQEEAVRFSLLHNNA